MMIDVPRNMGVHFVAGKGAGKSTVLAKVIAYMDFMFGVPLLIIDPHGGTIDNFLDKLMYLPAPIQRELRDSIVYIDMSGKSGYVGQFPLWYQLPHDTPRDVAYRFLSIIGRLDPSLRNAPIWGWNPMEKVGVNVGMLLYALGLPLTEAPNLLARPKDWESRIRQVKATVPECEVAADYFLHEYMPQAAHERKRDASTFLSKIQPFTHDRIMELMFCGRESSIDWADAISKKKAVLLDFRHERDPKFKILWALTTFLEHIQMRGMVRDQPVSVIIDELSFLLSLQAGGRDLLADDLDDLINRIARNNDLWLTLAHQEMYQVSEKTRNTLLSMGTQIIGYTTDQQAALDYAARFSSYKPYLVKKLQPVYRSDRGLDYVIDQTSVEFTAQEQLIMESRNFRNLKRFEFVLAVARGEGSSWGEMTKIKINEREAGINRQLVEQARESLVRRSGVKVTPRAATSPDWDDEPPDAPSEPAPKPPKPPRTPKPTGRRLTEQPAESPPEVPKPRPRSGRKPSANPSAS
jgi:hypothetical protein